MALVILEGAPIASEGPHLEHPLTHRGRNFFSMAVTGHRNITPRIDGLGWNRELLQEIEHCRQPQHLRRGIQRGLVRHLRLGEVRSHRGQIRARKSIFLLAQVELSSLPEIRGRFRRSAHRPGSAPVRNAPRQLLSPSFHLFVFCPFRTHAVLRFRQRPPFPVQAAFQQ